MTKVKSALNVFVFPTGFRMAIYASGTFLLSYAIQHLPPYLAGKPVHV